MAEILIKNMEIPKSCITGKIPDYEYCPFFGGCSKVSAKEERPSDCPLIELPPHGEAKDTDIAIKYIKSEMEDDFNETTTLDEKSYKEGMKRAIELIGYAPTVLEATT